MAKANPFVEVNRLRSLASAPEAQSELALELVRETRHPEALLAALKVLARAPRPEARPALVARYEALDAAGVKRDQGAYLRLAVIQALRPFATLEDVPLLERALFTYEVLPTSPEDVTGGLRATALVALTGLDDTLAAWHAVRLLNDARLAAMSGEPAVTAARVLAAPGGVLPLYGYAVRGGGHPEAVAECLRGLADLPASLLGDLVARLIGSPDEIVLVGLLDLLLAHARGDDHVTAIGRCLRTTPFVDVYRYAVAAIVAARRPAFLKEVLAVAGVETDPERQAILAESLQLADSDPAVRTALAELRRRRARR